MKATGREHASGVGDDQRDHNDLPLWNLPHPNDAQALRSYEEQYDYDLVGNILELVHTALGSAAGSWTRRYAYGNSPFGPGAPAVPANNRLHSTSLPGDGVAGPFTATVTHDANGNMTAMPHLASIAYTLTNQMRQVDLGGGGTAYYTYDAGGERVRKVIQRLGTTREERIYLGGWELYRKRQGANGDLVLERETLHVMDDARRIALVETKTVDAGVQGPLTIAARLRYQLDNHLGTATLELDETGLVISYEEYHPYGTSAYRSARNGVEVSDKRYRYTGKERDEETGFSYHSARYYAPWLARWTSADPAGMVDGPSIYVYCGDSPIGYMDQGGRKKTPSELFYDLYQINMRLAATLQASGAPSDLVAATLALAEQWKRLAIEGPPKPQSVPVLAALVPGLGTAVRPSSGADHPAVATYRNLTGNSALHTQQTTGGAGALIAGMSVAAAVGMRYFPTVTPIVVRSVSGPISREMHFEDPDALNKVVMKPARQVARAVRAVETIAELMEPPPPTNAAPGGGQGNNNGNGGSQTGPSWTNPPPGVDAEHYRDLGRDPAIGGRWRPNEADTALKLEQTRGISLERYHPTEKAQKGDWVDKATGEVYDGCSPGASQFFDKEMRKGHYERRLLDHTSHSNVKYVVIDTTGLNLSSAQEAKLESAINPSYSRPQMPAGESPLECARSAREEAVWRSSRQDGSQERRRRGAPRRGINV